MLLHAQSPRVIRAHNLGGKTGLPLGGVAGPPMLQVASALTNPISAATSKRIR